MAGSREGLLWAERADGYAAPLSVDRVYADLALADTKLTQGSHFESTRLRTRALELAREINDRESLFRAGGAALGADSHHDRKLQLSEEFTKGPREGVSTRALAEFLGNTFNVYLSWGRRAAAEDILEQMQELSQRTRDARTAVFPHRMRSLFLTVDGRLEGALEETEALKRSAEELGMPGFGSVVHSITALRPLLHLGRYDEALAALPQAASIAGREVSEAANTAARMLLVLAHAGRLEEARAGLRGWLASFGSGLEEAPTRSLAQLLEAAVMVEDRETAALLAAALAPWAQLSTTYASVTSIARHLGAAAALLGERGKAKAYYQQALEACAKIRFRPEIALTRLQLAELLLEEAEELAAGSPRPQPHGRGDLAPTGAAPDEVVGAPDPSDQISATAIRREAMVHLDFAIAEFTVMKMQPSLERALRHKGFLNA